MSARFRLRRPDGKVFLERWGWECKWFGIFVHHMQAPDPGRDLHDHPWWFGSLILKGGYYERRAACRTPHDFYSNERKRWSWQSLPRTVCHTIYALKGDTWTLVLHGPRRGTWGFYHDITDRWTEWHDYEGAGNTDLGRVD